MIPQLSFPILMKALYNLNRDKLILPASKPKQSCLTALAHPWLLHWPLWARVITEKSPWSSHYHPSDLTHTHPQHEKQSSLHWLANTAHHILPPQLASFLISLSSSTAAAPSLSSIEPASLTRQQSPSQHLQSSPILCPRTAHLPGCRVLCVGCSLLPQSQMLTTGSHRLAVLADFQPMQENLFTPMPRGVSRPLLPAGCAPGCFTQLTPAYQPTSY